VQAATRGRRRTPSGGSQPLNSPTESRGEPEFLNGSHYNGHPNQTFGHWIVGEGYYSYGDGAYFLDPATSVWTSVSPSFSYGTASFANRFLQSNGITW
jgi:hypothetical protein